MLDAVRFTSRMKSYPPGTDLPAHSHVAPRLCFVLSGGFEEVVAGRRERLQRGSALFRPAGAPHAQRFGRQGATCGLIDPGASWFDAAGEAGARFDHAQAVAGPDVLRLAQSLERESAVGDSFSRLSIQALLWEAAALFGRAERGPDPKGSVWAVRALEYLHAHSGEPIGLSQVATALGVHPGHLARAFRATFGEPLGARLRRIRAERAAFLIRGTDASLIDIAEDCGFAHQAHMTRVFRLARGVTPGRYRRERR